MNYSKWRKVIFAIRAIGVLCLVIGILLSRSLNGFILALVGLFIILISFVLSMWKNRCPDCGRFLYMSERSFRAPDFCPFCGGDLRDESDRDVERE